MDGRDGRGHIGEPSSNEKVRGHIGDPSSNEKVRGRKGEPSSNEKVRGHKGEPSSLSRHVTSGCYMLTSASDNSS